MRPVSEPHVAVFVYKPREPGGGLVRPSGMAGRTIDHPRHGRVFLHQHSGTQYHGQTRCPCPIDAVVLDWCRDQGLDHLYAHDRTRGTLAHTTLARLLAAPTLPDGGRVRRYLADEGWERLEDVTEEVRASKRVLAVGGHPILTWRFTRTQIILDPWAALAV